MTEENIKELVKSDEWMMSVLRAARDLDLPDWMIGAGFLRNKVWDHLHGYSKTEVETADIDLIYFDSLNTDEKFEKELDVKLREVLSVNWSCKNQARMHLKHNREPYLNSTEALSEWVETPTAVAIKLHKDDQLEIFAPLGIQDLVNLIVRPAPSHLNDLEHFWKRINEKKWLAKWPKLKVFEN